MKDSYIGPMIDSFQDELTKIAAQVTFNVSGDAVKYIGVALAGAVAALGVRKGMRDQKLGRVMRLQDELASDTSV